MTSTLDTPTRDSEDRTRRRRKALADVAAALVPDRLPPHSIEAEQGTLGCILIDPSTLATCQQRNLAPDLFYDLKHQVIYHALLQLRSKGDSIDLITLQQRLKDDKQLEAVGGIAYLMSLSDAVPSAANLPAYLDIVLKKATLRRVIRIATDVVSDAYEFEGDVHEVLDRLNVEAQSLLQEDRGAGSLGRQYSPEHLRTFDTSADPNSLLGDRWLCKRGKVVIAGPSGIGKSTLLMGWAAAWAIGRDVYGIRPVRPLLQWVIQAENDDGDMAEMLQGVERQLFGDHMERLAAEDDGLIELLNRNLVFKEVADKCGVPFLRALERDILNADHRPDVIWLDPLVAFAEKELTKQEGAAEFLRRGIDGVASRTGVAFIINHHTTKTSADPKSRSAWKLNDYQYAAAGSYDIAGWARAMVVFQAVDDATCRLMFPKRGRKAGLLNLDGSPAPEVWLKHADEGQAWVQVAPPPPPEEKAEKPARLSKAEQVGGLNLHEFLSAIPPEGETANSLSIRLAKFARAQGIKLSPETARKTCLSHLQLIEMLDFDDATKLYSKGPQA